MKTARKIGIFTLILFITVLTVISVKKYTSQGNINSVSVYFSRVQGNEPSQLVPVKRKITTDQKPIETAMIELLKGPASEEKKEGILTEIPVKTALLGIKETGDRVVINLSKEFESGGGSESMVTRLRQVTYTALDADRDKPVYLEINGIKAESIGGEGVEVPQPLSKNLSRNQEI